MIHTSKKPIHIAAFVDEVSKNTCRTQCKIAQSAIDPMHIAAIINEISKPMPNTISTTQPRTTITTITTPTTYQQPLLQQQQSQQQRQQQEIHESHTIH